MCRSFDAEVGTYAKNSRIIMTNKMPLLKGSYIIIHIVDTSFLLENLASSLQSQEKQNLPVFPRIAHQFCHIHYLRVIQNTTLLMSSDGQYLLGKYFE